MAKREAYEKSPDFKKGQRFRAGIEGRIPSAPSLAKRHIANRSRVVLESLSAKRLPREVRYRVSYLFHLGRFVSVELVAPGEPLRFCQFMRLEHAEADTEILVITDRN